MRPEIKIGDLVRFRTDGEIGLLNKMNGALLGSNLHTVTDKYNNMIEIDGNTEVREVMLDICNNFSGIQVGDEVEISEKGTQIVTEVFDSCFHTNQAGRFLKADGRFYYAGNFVRALRIFKKATIGS
jgi:hypothetical protein